ncbi:hypothetical protein [Fodinibius sp. AD559]|uniref:hypothetical protein n=1 Tax=Fodinibius sp. AD559 TaxID=3424179 RepID=UPI004046AFD7
MKTDNYVQFPLHFLKKSKDPKELFYMTTGHTLFRYADHYANNGQYKTRPIIKKKMLDKCDFSVLKNIAQYFPPDEIQFRDYVFMGMDFWLEEEELVELTKYYRAIQRELYQDEKLVKGKSPTIRLRFDLLEDFKNGSFSANLFQVYCAILSVVGRKRVCRITYDHIQYRAAGYRSKNIYTKCLKMGEKEAEFLTKKQISYAVDKLEEKSLLATLLYKNRLKYYSVRLNIDELYQAVKKIKSRSSEYFTKKKHYEKHLLSLSKKGEGPSVEEEGQLKHKRLTKTSNKTFEYKHLKV